MNVTITRATESVVRPTESGMADPLMEWLFSTRRVRNDSLLAQELPWYGRRVDLASLSATLRTTAFELKLRNNRRAIEQAAYNKLAFDRSYIVTAARPKEPNVRLAAKLGVGVILLHAGRSGFRVIQASKPQQVHRVVRARLIEAIRRHGAAGVHVR